MIGPDRLRRAEWIIAESGVLDILQRVLRKDPRGCPYDGNKLRIILLGLLLTIESQRTGSIRKVVELIYNDLPLDEQHRLGIKDPVTGKWLITEHDFYNFTRKVSDRLGYGPSVPDVFIDKDGRTKGITAEERAERHDAVQRMCGALLATTFVGPNPSAFAIDATGVWSWGRGKKAPELSEIEAAQLADGIEDRDAVPVVASDVQIEGRGSTHDPDARWSKKTSKSGKSEVFFGYHEHTLVQVPAAGEDADTAPRLIRAFELTPATTDVPEVSLRLLDRVHDGVGRVLLLADRLYHYSQFAKWWQPLHRRNVRPVHDLRETDQGFVPHDRMRWAAGHAHCPAVPDSLGRIVRPAVNDKRTSSHKAFHKAMDLREAYALVRHSQPDVDGVHRVMCPALAGKIGCALRPGTVQVAGPARIPFVEKPPSAADPEGLPACCTQKTVLVRPTEQIAKLLQPVYWGSREWVDLYNRRTYVEGSYGSRKHPATENLRRGHFHVTGLPLVHLMMAMVNVSYNVRMIENWYIRNLDRHRPRQVLPADHPLLYDDSAIAGYRTVTSVDEYGTDASPEGGGPSSVHGRRGRYKVRRRRVPAKSTA